MSNDRLKFRVWYDPQCDGLEPRYFYDVQDVYDGSIEGLGWISCFGDLLDTPEQYTVEQCTGLKDKNGKLIYEGDIITTAFEYETPTEYDTYAVKWCKAYSGEMFCSVDERGERISFYGGIPMLEYCRVIGNIHEIDTLRVMLPENDEEKEHEQ